MHMQLQFFGVPVPPMFSYGNTPLDDAQNDAMRALLAAAAAARVTESVSEL